MTDEQIAEQELKMIQKQEPCPDCGHPGYCHCILSAECWGWLVNEAGDLLHKVPSVRCAVFLPVGPSYDPYACEEQCDCKGHSLWPVADRPKILTPEDAVERDRFNSIPLASD